MSKTSVSFEVFGRVQGVFFRKHTHKTAVKLHLVGWVQNTKHNTVVGIIQGSVESINKMKQWLQTEGSPRSRIDKCEFKSETEIMQAQFIDFSVKR